MARIIVCPFLFAPQPPSAIPFIVPRLSAQPLCPTFNCSSQLPASERPQTLFPPNFPGIFTFCFPFTVRNRWRGDTPWTFARENCKKLPLVCEGLCPSVDKVLPLIVPNSRRCPISHRRNAKCQQLTGNTGKPRFSRLSTLSLNLINHETSHCRSLPLTVYIKFT